MAAEGHVGLDVEGPIPRMVAGDGGVFDHRLPLGHGQHKLLAKSGRNGSAGFKQGFEMTSFLTGQLDAASAMTYNEHNVVLEAGVKPEDLNVISYNAEGVGMLEDHLFINQTALKGNKDALVRFLAASQKGWIYAVQNQGEAVDMVMTRVDPSATTRAHQETMMKEVAKLVMPEGLTPGQVGVIDPAKFQTTADIALKFKVISKAASGAYINDYINIAGQMNGYNIYAINPGGMLCLMCDGSVQTVSTSIGILPWSAAVTPTGGSTCPPTARSST